MKPVVEQNISKLLSIDYSNVSVDSNDNWSIGSSLSPLHITKSDSVFTVEHTYFIPHY